MLLCCQSGLVVDSEESELTIVHESYKIDVISALGENDLRVLAIFAYFGKV